MSQISIRRTHNLPLKKARELAEKVAKQLEADFDLEYAWDGHVLKFERPGVAGDLHVTASEVRVEARLGLLLGFLKARIEQEVEEQLDRLFPAAGAVPAKRPAAKKSAKGK
jgi:putative polyhydroxyalkanoate system protein